MRHFFYKKGGSVAEDRLVPFQRRLAYCLVVDLFQCIQAVSSGNNGISFLERFGLNDEWHGGCVDP